MESNPQPSGLWHSTSNNELPRYLYTMDTGPFPEVKRSERDVDYTLPSTVEVKERVELYLYCPFVCSWSVIGRNFPFNLPN